MDEEKFEELCKKLMIVSLRDKELFFQGYTLGYLDGKIDAIKGGRTSKTIPDAETR